MSSFEGSMMDIMIGLHEYNQLISTRDDYSRLSLELQEKAKKYDLLERDYFKLFEQKKELEKDVKKISTVSISLSSKMIENQQNYLKLIKEIEDEKAKLFAEKQLLIAQLIHLKDSENNYFREQKILEELFQFSFPSISSDSILKEEEINHNTVQTGTVKIQISHDVVPSQLFRTQPPNKKQNKKAQKEQPFISSLSTIPSKKIADKIRRLVKELQMGKKKLAEYQIVIAQARENSISRQSNISEASEISQPSSMSISTPNYQIKYKKLKLQNKHTLLKLQTLQKEYKKLKNICSKITITQP